MKKTLVLLVALALSVLCSGCVHRVEHHDSVDDFGYVYAAAREFRSTHENPDYGDFVRWTEEGRS